jgi:uncharacterized protein (DUF302 family)
MTRFIMILILGLAAQITVAEGMVKKASNLSVAVTLDKLTRIITEKGFTVVARVDHAAAAKKSGFELLPTQLLIFGNPAVGTKLMQSQRSIGLDLPIKVLAWEEADGTVWVDYTDPGYLLARHGIVDRGPIRNKMTGALAAFTEAATN